MSTLYEEILAIARNYMGPAAEDYIGRRIRIVQHGADPASIGPERLERLAAGIDMTAKVYMPPARAERFRNEVLQLKKRFDSTPG